MFFCYYPIEVVVFHGHLSVSGFITKGALYSKISGSGDKKEVAEKGKSIKTDNGLTYYLYMNPIDNNKVVLEIVVEGHEDYLSSG